MRVLYVDHERETYQSTLQLLTRHAPHLKFYWASTGMEALRRLDTPGSADEYDVVLLDYDLPDLNGLEVLKGVRQERRLNLPVVMMTARREEPIALQALKIGAADFVVKDSDYIHRLPRVLESAVYQAQLLREQEQYRRLYAETQERLAEQSLLYDLGQALALADDENAVMKLVAGHMTEQLGGTSAVYDRFDEPTHTLRTIFEYWVERAQVPERETTLGMVWSPDQYPHWAAAYEQRFPQVITPHSPGLTSLERTTLARWAARTIIVIPAILQGRFTGFFEVWNSAAEREYDERTLRLMLTMATQAAMKLENLQLVQRLEDSVQHATEMARAAESANRLKSEFLANTSHELRTPLTAIQGALSIVTGGLCESEDEEHQWIDTAYASSEKLLGMINTLLDVARLEADRLVLNATAVEMVWLMREVEGLMRPQAEAKHLTLHLDMSEPGPTLWVDRDRVRQIILSLVDNAVKFTEAGSVSVSLVTQPDVVEIVVRDTGPGLPEAVKTRLFQPFVQADGSSTRRHGGNGVGLYIAHRLTGMMGGTLAITGAEAGRGTLATLRLPRLVTPLPDVALQLAA
jgi:signal transduction histidine kinase/FixJ family two-component response regulator